MMKTRPIDKYIRRATSGLPHLERIDTAAEIRVNLNLRIKELMLEGHPKEEAEFLAIQDMGDAFTTNRALLGHAFTHRLGWALMVITLLGISSWWVWQHRWDYFWGSTMIEKLEPSSQERLDFSTVKNGNIVQPMIDKLRIHLPRGTKSIEVIMATTKTSRWFVASSQAKGVKHLIQAVNVPTYLDLIIANTEHQDQSGKTYLNLGVGPDTRDSRVQRGSGFRFSYTEFSGLERWAEKNQFDYFGSTSCCETPLKLNRWKQIKLLQLRKSGSSESKEQVAILVRITDQPMNKLTKVVARVEPISSTIITLNNQVFTTEYN